jgi:hypothetical protein
MKELRERGLYRLPDGAELVASPAARGGRSGTRFTIRRFGSVMACPIIRLTRRAG